MSIIIHRVRLGYDNCYLIRGDGIVMIDGGGPGQSAAFGKALRKLAIDPRDVKLIVITHGHWDHVGSAKAVKEITGAPIAMHQSEKGWLEGALKPLPPGVTPWGRVFAGIMALFLPLVHVPPASVDVVLGDEAVPLSSYGVPGKVLHTPGHSPGSVSVLLDTGEAFVGDLAMAGFPLRFRPGLPILAEDMKKVKESWGLLLDAGAETVYPAHGNPFPSEVMRRAISL